MCCSRCLKDTCSLIAPDWSLILLLRMTKVFIGVSKYIVISVKPYQSQSLRAFRRGL